MLYSDNNSNKIIINYYLKYILDVEIDHKTTHG